MNERVDVVVVGAGVSGLAAALGAERAGASVIVLEQSDRVGGVVRSTLVDNFLVEHGPNSFGATKAAMQTLRDIGIEGNVIQPSPAAKRRYVVRGGTMRALPASPPALLSSGLLSWRGKIRALTEPFVKRSDGAEESLGSLVRRRLGQEVLDYFVDPFVSGVYAGDPERLSSRHAMRMLSELEQQHGSILRGVIRAARARRNQGSDGPPQGHIVSLKDGLEGLPAALAGAISKPVRTGAAVRRILQTTDGWAVSYETPNDVRTLSASSVVLALPAHGLRSIEWPATAEAGIDILRNVPHAPVATVALGFSRDSVQRNLDGFGVLVPHIEKRDILGAVFNSTLFPDRAPEGHVLMTVFVGGARSAGLPSDGDLIYTALREVQFMLGAQTLPAMSHVTRWEAGIPQYVLGHDKVLASASELEATHGGLIFTGSYLRGVSLGDCLANGLIAGQRAVAAVSALTP